MTPGLFPLLLRTLLVAVIALSLILHPVPAAADEPGWYEKYMLRVVCAQNQCVKSPAADLPPSLLQTVESAWLPVVNASRISPGDRPQLFYTVKGGVNAWALKHYWGLDVTLLSLGLSRDELAFVAAHEMAHIELGHYQRKIDQIASIYVIAFLAILLSGGNYNPLNDPFFRLAVDLTLAAYSREHESDADLHGLRLMHSAGFDPRAAPAALLKIKPFGAAGRGDLFDSHPSIDQRVARLETEVASLPLPVGQVTAAPPAPPVSTPAVAAPPSPSTPSRPNAPQLPPTPRAALPSPGPVGSPRPSADPGVIVVREIAQQKGWSAIVRVGGVEVFRLQTAYEGKDPFQRADLAAAKLNALLGKGLKPQEVKNVVKRGRDVIVARDEVILTIDPFTARLNRTNTRTLASRWAKSLRIGLGWLQNR